MSIRYPYSRPMVTDEDVAAIVEAARSQFLTQGSKVGAFEVALCDALGARHAAVCNSGTAALHMIYAGLGAGPAAAVVVPAVTFLATASAARMCGAPVILADVDPVSGLITPETLDQALRGAAGPVSMAAVVHLAGQVCEMESLHRVARQYGCILIEDACHAPGASYEAGGIWHRVGACAHSAAAAFSFHAVKHVAMGEGGAVLTNDPALQRSNILLRSHGMVREAENQQLRPEERALWYYEMNEIGWNYRADEMACSLGLSQLSRLQTGLQRRRELVAVYDRMLADMPNLRRPAIPRDATTHAWHLYQVGIDFAAIGKSRGQVMAELAAAGIGTQVHYIPLHLQPYYRRAATPALPGAEAFYAQTLSLPLYVQLTEQDIGSIATTLRAVLTRP